MFQSSLITVRHFLSWASDKSKTDFRTSSATNPWSHSPHDGFHAAKSPVCLQTVFTALWIVAHAEFLFTISCLPCMCLHIPSINNSLCSNITQKPNTNTKAIWLVSVCRNLHTGQYYSGILLRLLLLSQQEFGGFSKLVGYRAHVLHSSRVILVILNPYL